MDTDQSATEGSPSSAPSHITLSLEPNDARNLAALCGQLDSHLRQIETRLGITIHNRSNTFELRGARAHCEIGASLLTSLYSEVERGLKLSPESIHLRLQEANLETLSDARLDHLQLPETDFMTPIIEETAEGRTAIHLQPADLHGSRLRRADLRHSRLDSADLAGADLRDSKLQGASLKGADLRGADLRGVDLTGAKLDEALLHDPNPTWSTATTMPAGQAWSGPPEAATSGQ